MNSATYLKTFFAEKNLPNQEWEIISETREVHYISTEDVIEFLLNSSEKIQDKAAGYIRRIDFSNGDVNHFLKFIAEGVVNKFYEKGA